MSSKINQLQNPIGKNTNSITNDRSLEPYIGPRPFKRDEKDLLRFFGRDTETDEIVSLITSHRVTLIYAQSGAGKTSIFNTQVTNTLGKYGFEVLPMARVRVTTTFTGGTINSINIKNNNSTSSPSSQQIENLYIYNAIQSLCPDESNFQNLSDLSLFEFLDLHFPNQKDENNDSRPQVLIFDQLEELFNFYPDKWLEQQKEFFEHVADSLENNPLLQVVFIIREDYLAQLDPFKNIFLEKLRPRFRLERLGRKEATLAMKGPLKNIISNYSEDEKKNIDSEIKELVNDLLKIYVETPDGSSRPLEGEFIEPIQLQVVCRRWWNVRGKPNITQNKTSTLEDLANVNKALKDFYEEAIQEAIKQTRVKEREIRNWCQEKLITSSGTRSIIHREPNFTGGIENKVIEILEDKYLIRREWRSGASWYELTHDRLINPIKDSNKKWKIEQDRKKRNKNKKIIVPTVTVIAILSVILFIYYYSPNNTELPINNSLLIGDGPLYISINPATNIAYVANSGDNTVSVIDGKTNSVITNIKVGNNPIGVSINPATNIAYVTNAKDGTVSVIDGKTNNVTNTIKVGNNPYDVSVNPATNIAYVANRNNGSISVIDGMSNSVIDNIKVGRLPSHLTINNQTNIAYVTNAKDGTVSVIDGKKNKAIPITQYENNLTVKPPSLSPLPPINQPLSIDITKQYQIANRENKVSLDISKIYAPTNL
ncbi:MAG: YncE family protein [Candidatus Nitrosocosmicus sp.]